MNDTIYRQAAIDEIRKCRFVVDAIEKIRGLPSAQPEPIKINIEDFNKEDWERLKKEWGNTPITVLSAQPEQRWIPCSERLPKPYEYCLWTTTDGRVIYHHCDGLFSNYTAWMPLPEPYQKEGGE